MQSGHIIFGDIMPAGDGMLTSLTLARAAVRPETVGTGFGKKASDLGKREIQYPDKVVSRPRCRRLSGKVSKDLEGVGRVVVRPSGTEPLVDNG